jgi:hypothetical protein
VNRFDEQALRLAPANTYTSADLTKMWSEIDALRATLAATQAVLVAPDPWEERTRKALAIVTEYLSNAGK